MAKKKGKSAPRVSAFAMRSDDEIELLLKSDGAVPQWWLQRRRKGADRRWSDDPSSRHEVDAETASAFRAEASREMWERRQRHPFERLRHQYEIQAAREGSPRALLFETIFHAIRMADLLQDDAAVGRMARFAMAYLREIQGYLRGLGIAELRVGTQRGEVQRVLLATLSDALARYKVDSTPTTDLPASRSNRPDEKDPFAAIAEQLVLMVATVFPQYCEKDHSLVSASVTPQVALVLRALHARLAQEHPGQADLWKWVRHDDLKAVVREALRCYQIPSEVADNLFQGERQKSWRKHQQEKTAKKAAAAALPQNGSEPAKS